MNKAERLRYYIESLCIYDLKNDRVISALAKLLGSTRDESVIQSQSEFFNTLSAYDSLKHYISSLILTDDNVFTKSAASSGADKLPESVIDGVKSDLRKLEALSSITAKDIFNCVDDNDIKEILSTMPGWETGNALLPLTHDWDEQIDSLIKFHKTNGYGIFAKYAAFTWRDESLLPISCVDPIRLTDLKKYEIQRKTVVDNTRAFLDGLPANNVLLYGDRGTGKCSTDHALLNEYKNSGLRMIEISKGDIGDLTLIREKISDSPMKFIIFIDDLSFDTHDDSFGELKAALEGSLSGRQDNTLIYATSNRRHLIKENFSDRENDVNRSDTLQEELSLSDRFGLSITFINPDKKEYEDIVAKIAADRNINADTEALCEKAEQWARRRGGRSPRCAKQFIDYVESCIAHGKEW